MPFTFITSQVTPDVFQVVDPVVIYPRADGGLCVISGFLSSAMLEGEELEAFIRRRAGIDVPTGRPFRIVQAATIPDRFFREAWVADFSTPDGVGAVEGKQNKTEVSLVPLGFQTPGPTASASGVVEINMPRARLCHQHRMRIRRAELWPQVDAARNLATDAGDVQALAAVRAKAQALRDVTRDPGITAAQTPDQLKAVWPDVLK